MNYWDERYKSGGTSGSGSIGILRDWKWKVINSFQNQLDDVIDVGCGDLSFWEGKPLPKNYIGIDISSIIINKNILKYPNSRFIVSNGNTLLPIFANNVFCLDVLFHIMDDDDYKKILNNLCSYSTEFIFIYTWLDNPLRTWYGLKKDKDNYQRYHDPSILHSIMNKNNFKCISISKNPDIDGYGALLVFKRGEIN